MLKLNDYAPLNISLKTSEDKSASLKDFIGKKVVLYFYPKDNTPGCTKEACSFRDFNDELQDLGVVVLGVSKDSLKSHQKFITEQRLNFPLLSDPDHFLAESFGVWAKKKMMGREYMGMLRTTFLINEKGIIEKVWENVSPENHAKEIWTFLKN
jgi:peroxiredoxin Q/BCP